MQTPPAPGKAAVTRGPPACCREGSGGLPGGGGAPDFIFSGRRCWGDWCRWICRWPALPTGVLSCPPLTLTSRLFRPSHLLFPELGRWSGTDPVQSWACPLGWGVPVEGEYCLGCGRWGGRRKWFPRERGLGNLVRSSGAVPASCRSQCDGIQSGRRDPIGETRQLVHGRRAAAMRLSCPKD